MGARQSRQFAASHRREHSTPKELPRRGSNPDREEQGEGLDGLLGNTATFRLPQGTPLGLGYAGVLAPLSQANAPAVWSRASRMETAEEAARTASRTTGQDPGEEQELDAEAARCSRAGTQGTYTLLDLFRGLLRVSQAENCAAKAPDKFADTPRENCHLAGSGRNLPKGETGPPG